MQGLQALWQAEFHMTLPLTKLVCVSILIPVVGFHNMHSLVLAEMVVYTLWEGCCEIFDTL